MKLTTIILITAILQVSASTFAQRISLSEKNASLTAVLDRISTQTGYDFFYKSINTKNLKTISIEVENLELKDVLKRILEPQNLDFEIDDSSVIIKVKQGASSENQLSQLKEIDVKGRVVDEEGRPLVGATVKIKGTKISNFTNANGEFNLSVMKEDAMLQISFTGYVTKEIRADNDLSGVVLVFSNSKLDEVQVIAYSTISRRLNTGNVSSIKAEDLERQPVSNPLLTLQGRLPGLIVSQADGLPGSGVNVRIQGINSISNGSDPFYVIDGVPYNSSSLSGIGLLNIGTSPLNFIDPSSIESIDVLKDADATAIYGSRAANGAILITTKKGKAGRTKFEINSRIGFGKVNNKMDLLTTKEYLDLRKEAYFKNDGLDENSFDYQFANDINGNWDLTRYTDWQKELIGGSSKYTNIQGSLSGGDSNTQYRLGGSQNIEGTVFPGKSDDKKAAFHIGITNTSNDKKFGINFSGSYLSDINKLFNNDLTAISIQTPPNAPNLFQENGQLNWQPDLNGNSTFYNPLSYLNHKYSNATTNILGSAMVSYKIYPNLTIKSSFGFTRLQSDQSLQVPLTGYSPETRPYVQRSTDFSNSNSQSWLIEPQMTYESTSRLGEFDFLIGSSFQKKKDNQVSMTGKGFTNDAVMSDIKSASNVTINNSLASLYKYNAVFGRVSYNYDGRYLLNFNIRRDGSSRFGTENLFQNFYSIGTAWIFSEEKFAEGFSNVISFGKIKASYGTTGNDLIGDYRFLNLYESYNPGVPYQGSAGLVVSGHANPHLQWELTRKFNIGLDIGIFRDRILLGANYFKNRSSNQLLGTTLPFLTGFGGVSTNLPATVQNTGVEISLNTAQITNGNFRWSSTLTYYSPHNKVVRFDNLDQNPNYREIVFLNEPLGQTKVFNYAGVEPATGLYQFIDAKGNLTVSPNTDTDQYLRVNTLPKSELGLQNNLRYKNFELDFFFQFRKQVKNSYRFGFYPGSFQGLGPFGNQPARVVNRWRNVDDNTEFEKASSLFGGNYYFATNSQAAFEDASYLRLKNVMLSYKFFSQKFGITSLSLFLQGQNLLTFTKYKGLDPESNYLSLPPLRITTLGLKLIL